MTRPGRRTVHMGLAVAGFMLAALAAVNGDAATGATSTPTVEALQLARWIREGRPDLRVVDLRETHAFETLAIPSAERMALHDVERERWHVGSTVVFYADDDAVATRAQRMVRAARGDNALVLRDGIAGWVRTIAAPVLPARPSPEQAAASQEIAEMSRWFGGVPRVGEPTSNPDSLRAAIARIRRRGC